MLSQKPGTFARPALAIFGVALAVRLVHVWQIRAAPFFSVLMGDSRSYDEWAQRIARGDWMGTEVFYQAPLYPYVLGAIYTVAGRHLLLVRIVQILIGSASCALLALAAARLFGRRAVLRLREGQDAQDSLEFGRKAGIAAGLMLALYAPAIFFDGLLQKSVLDVFFVCLALWLITKTETAEHAERAEKTASLPREKRSSPRSQRSPRLSIWVWLGLGLAMGGLALTRENALVFIVVILAWVFVQAGGIKPAAWFLAGLALVLMPVAARNAYVGGGFFITTSQLGPNFYIGNNPNADGTYQSLRFGRGAPEYERQDATELAERALGRRLSPGEVSSYWVGKALDFVWSAPGAWLRVMGRKTALLWNAGEMIDTESQESYAEWSWPLRFGGLVGHFGVLVPLAVLGLVLTWPVRSRLWVFYAMLAAYAASVVVFYVFARYRYPLVPLLVLFAAPAVAALPALVRRRTVPGGGLTLAAVAVVAVATNWPMLSTTMMRAVTENNLATALQAEGRLDEAADHYKRAIALEPEYAPAYNNLATALRGKGQVDEAIRTYQRALSLRPDYPEAQYNLANALTDAGKPEEAAAHFRLALEKIPAGADVHNNLGIALMNQGKTNDAIAEFQAALQLEPGSLPSHRNLASALASAKRFDEAIAHFRQAAALDPSGAAHYDLGSLLIELERPDEAVVEFRAALTAMPRSADAHNNLGIALGMQGRLDDAIAEFKKALEIQPGFEDARKNLAMALAATRQ